MNITAKMDLYCERTDVTFWSEPLNAVSNLSAIGLGLLALIWIFRIKDELKSGPYLVTLSVVPVVIGVGSFFFHSFATVWGFWADVLPITLFQLLAMNFAFSKLFKYSAPTSICLLILFVLSSSLLGKESLQGFLSGSLTYMPSLIFMIVLYLKSRTTSNVNLEAASLSILLVFSFALCFRSLDLFICDIFPAGTHFVWHLLSGVLFFLCIQYALFLDGSRKRIANFSFIVPIRIK